MKEVGKKIEVYDIDYGDVEDWVREIYGFNYEFLCQNEVGTSQYSSYLKVEASAPTQKDLDEGCEMPEITAEHGYYEIMDDLVFRGVIPEGTYLIAISW